MPQPLRYSVEDERVRRAMDAHALNTFYGWHYTPEQLDTFDETYIEMLLTIAHGPDVTDLGKRE
jgi:hypothetical protein